MRNTFTPRHTASPKPPSAGLAIVEGAAQELAEAIERIRAERALFADKLTAAEDDVRRLAARIRGLDAALAVLEQGGSSS